MSPEIKIDFSALMPSSSSKMQKIKGSIQEVLDRLQKLNITARKLTYYSDDGVNAEAFFCKIR